MIRNIPNILSVLRLILVPVFICVFVKRPDDAGIALGIYIAAMLTDAVDGFLARKMHCESRFGALVDPLADKLMTIAAVSCIVYAGIIPLPSLLMIGIKEFIMMVCAAIAARSGVVIPAALPGKLATVMFTVSLILLMPWHGVTSVYTAGSYILYAAIIMSYIAAAYYASLLFKAFSSVKAR